MNMLVLAVAGVFVLAGLVLIVLSFLVGRSKPATESAQAGASPAEATAAFIDQPLATDMANDLKDRKRIVPAVVAAVTATAPEVVKPVAAGAGAAGAGAAVADIAGEAEEKAEEKAVVAVSSAPPSPSPAANLVGFNFRVQLGFKFLQNGLYEDGVAEFQKALALTDDRDAKLKLYVEIGNAFRTQHMKGPAAASYMQATSYTENPMLLEHLERTISEMMESDTSTQGTSGSTKEE